MYRGKERKSYDVDMYRGHCAKCGLHVDMTIEEGNEIFAERLGRGDVEGFDTSGEWNWFLLSENGIITGRQEIKDSKVIDLPDLECECRITMYKTVIVIP